MPSGTTPGEGKTGTPGKDNWELDSATGTGDDPHLAALVTCWTTGLPRRGSRGEAVLDGATSGSKANPTSSQCKAHRFEHLGLDEAPGGRELCKCTLHPQARELANLLLEPEGLSQNGYNYKINRPDFIYESSGQQFNDSETFRGVTQPSPQIAIAIT